MRHKWILFGSLWGVPRGEHSALSSDHLLRILGTNPVANPVIWKSPFVEVPKLEVLGFVDTFIVDRSGPYFILLFTHIGEQKALVCARSDHYYCVNESQNHQFRDLSFETVFSNENHKYYKKKKSPRGEVVSRHWLTGTHVKQYIDIRVVLSCDSLIIFLVRHAWHGKSERVASEIAAHWS